VLVEEFWKIVGLSLFSCNRLKSQVLTIRGLRERIGTCSRSLMIKSSTAPLSFLPLLSFFAVSFLGVLFVALRHPSAAFLVETYMAPGHDGPHASAWFSPPPSALETALGSFRLNYQPHYEWSKSTEDNYRSNNGISCGRFKTVREKIDYAYHAKFTCARQFVQDIIIDSMLNETIIDDHETGRSCNAPTEPWIIFTAGVMGAGKTHTIRSLDEQGIFPLKSFVSVDPDEMRRHLPEFAVYVDKSPETAGELTRKEAGMMSEILTEAALERGQNVLVDGSLRDAAWYQNYFAVLRRSFPKIRIGIIHVTAPTDVIFERARVSRFSHFLPHFLLANF
jgi:predicted kinase